MTSETQEKSLPFIVRAHAPQYKGGTFGWIVIISCWIFLYFWGVTSLVDGLIEWFSYDLSANLIQVAITLSTTAMSTIEGLVCVFSEFVVFQLPLNLAVASITHTVPLEEFCHAVSRILPLFRWI